MNVYISSYLAKVSEIAKLLNPSLLEQLVDKLVSLHSRKGRLFFLGVGGSAANCSHAVNDFRKLCGIEAYAPVDNISELTARTNDEGWETVFAEWLKTSNAGEKDALFILSVGGGNKEANISTNIISAIDEGKKRGLKIFGIVGNDGGYTKANGDLVIVIPTIDKDFLTPLTESFQSVICHALVSHPKLQKKTAKWERTLLGAVR